MLLFMGFYSFPGVFWRPLQRLLISERHFWKKKTMKFLSWQSKIRVRFLRASIKPKRLVIEATTRRKWWLPGLLVYGPSSSLDLTLPRGVYSIFHLLCRRWSIHPSIQCIECIQTYHTDQKCGRHRQFPVDRKSVFLEVLDNSFPLWPTSLLPADDQTLLIQQLQPFCFRWLVV